MDYKEFLNKHGLKGMPVEIFPSLLSALDYLYTSHTRDQAIEIISDYYDNADDIFNSLNESVKTVSEQINSFLEELVENINNMNKDKEEETKSKKDFEA